MTSSDLPANPPTLHDVAREAGVSLATASRSLNGSARTVREPYREKVLTAAARLGYTPNLSAQAVAKGSTMTVALLVADISDPYFSSIAAGVIRAADEVGLVVTMAATERDTRRELELVRAMRGQRPRVIILAGSRVVGDEYEQQLTAELTAFQATGGRVTLISQSLAPFHTVLLDNYAGARALASELVGLGYSRFAAIAGAAKLRTASDRLSGFRAGLADHGLELPESDVAVTAFTRDGGYAGAEQLIPRITDFDLVFAVNDVMAVGAMSALRDAGITPGVDIAVAGYDDIPTVRDVTPALTTVRIPLEEVGARALALALGTGAPEDPIATEVILRASTPRKG
ncbi:LacI family DNA-binding transcriptional regulator [Leifsonia sp. Leaf264]|uniref:LacI family DNA-binding transcriptional regulator n=1 Tax=Leifsonia sp. Leaf264 TaxID=1736314 RepID=UPI0006FE9BCB|nr:LacI family DNA-binding transcriptional regulator [Leifsonia sp. Leaf264]KQO97040.1 LacI family transcriptional regulator [Leifsonia sp. Leaf264]